MKKKADVTDYANYLRKIVYGFLVANLVSMFFMECCYECLTSNKVAAVIILTGFMMINIGLNGALIGLYV
jgi:hypothetical protein